VIKNEEGDNGLTSGGSEAHFCGHLAHCGYDSSNLVLWAIDDYLLIQTTRVFDYVCS
jgi:hypothetical protein